MRSKKSMTFVHRKTGKLDTDGPLFLRRQSYVSRCRLVVCLGRIDQNHSSGLKGAADRRKPVPAVVIACFVVEGSDDPVYPPRPPPPPLLRFPLRPWARAERRYYALNDDEGHSSDDDLLGPSSRQVSRCKASQRVEG